MGKWIKFFLGTALFVAIAVLSVWYFSRVDLMVLNPSGLIGVKQRDLLWICTILMLIVVIPVFILTGVIVWRYRAGKSKGKYDPEWNHSTIAEIIWWGVPFIIVVILGALNWVASYDLDPYKPIASDKKAIKIQVVALDWKWLFIYPDEGIATVNFIQFPVGTPLDFDITADAPMNSFWIPALGGQIFAMPGMRTKLSLIADKAGDFMGLSANLSGKGFAGMRFTARAGSEEEYKKWLLEVKSKGTRLDVESYKKLALPSEYNPVAYYRLAYSDLFNWVLMREMAHHVD